MRFGFAVKTQVPGLRRVAAHLGVDEQGDVQRFLTGEVAKRLPGYMPRRSGALVSGLRIDGPARITVDGEYARTQFFGVTKDGKPFSYDTSANPKAGSHWDRRLMADEAAQIRAVVQRYVKSKGR